MQDWRGREAQQTARWFTMTQCLWPRRHMVVQGQFGCGGRRTCDLCLYGLTTYWAAGRPPGNQEERTWRFTGEVQIYFTFPARGSTNGRLSDSKSKWRLFSEFKPKSAALCLPSCVTPYTLTQTDLRLLVVSSEPSNHSSSFPLFL